MADSLLDDFGDDFFGPDDKNVSGETDNPFDMHVPPDTNENPIMTTTNNVSEVPSGIPFLRGDLCSPSYISLVERVQSQYSTLPVLNYDDIYQEIAELSVTSVPTPTLEVLNDEIQKVQSAKDRLAEIFINVLKCHNIKKRCVDILMDSWAKFADEKSADKRKGDGVFRLSEFMIDFANVEACLKSCQHILKNLDSLHESLSRRITIYQLTMKLGDIGRGALPDFDFTSQSDPSEDIGDSEIISTSEELSPISETF